MEFASIDSPLLGPVLCLPANRPAARPPGRPTARRRPPAAHGPPAGQPWAARPRLPTRCPPVTRPLSCPPDCSTHLSARQSPSTRGEPRAKLSIEKRQGNVWHQVCELRSNLQYEVHRRMVDMQAEVIDSVEPRHKNTPTSIPVSAKITVIALRASSAHNPPCPKFQRWRHRTPEWTGLRKKRSSLYGGSARASDNLEIGGKGVQHTQRTTRGR